MYFELHSRSAFSFLEGASLPETLIGTAANLGMKGIALLDADGIYGAPRFHMAAGKAGLKAFIGAEITSELSIGNCQLPIANRKGFSIDNRQSTIDNFPRLPLLVSSRLG